MDTQKQSSLPVLKLLLPSANMRLTEEDDVGHFEMFLHLPDIYLSRLLCMAPPDGHRNGGIILAILSIKSFLKCAIFSQQGGGQVVIFEIYYTCLNWNTWVCFKGPFDFGFVG